MIGTFMGWIALGLVAGFLTNFLIFRKGEDLPLDLILGVAGAIVGGWLFRAFGTAGVSGFNPWSVLVSVVGAIVLVGAWRAVRGPLSHA
jgi:uncharacterized membrane protein YeaQ/YmgE (transglycosylase-associated protein family)